MCPMNQYLAGVASYHDNNSEDRRFQFQCCSASNNYDQYVNYKLQHIIFTGTLSVHE